MKRAARAVPNVTVKAKYKEPTVITKSILARMISEEMKQLLLLYVHVNSLYIH